MVRGMTKLANEIDNGRRTMLRIAYWMAQLRENSDG